MFEISIKQLLEAGVHFGHPTKKWDPRMAEYIFTQRNGIQPFWGPTSWSGDRSERLLQATA